MIIRPETAADHDAIRKVNDAACEVEAKLVDAIRASDRFLPELSLVAVSSAPYYERFGFTRADAAGIEPPTEAHGPRYFMVPPLARYDAAFRGRAVYPPETFGIAY